MLCALCMSRPEVNRKCETILQILGLYYEPQFQNYYTPSK